MRKNKTKRVLLCIDTQNDFTTENGALYVDGSSRDVENITNLINNHHTMFERCVLTMDSHPHNHISFAENWAKIHDLVDSNSSENVYNYTNVAPFTTIDESVMVKPDIVYTHDIMNLCEQREYLKIAKTITLWPKHCVENTHGWDIDTRIKKALSDTYIKHSFFLKGQSPKTEFYSAISPILENNDCKTQSTNFELINLLKKYDEIYVCGEAMDFCVLETVKDLTKYLDTKIIILEDCMSSIDKSKTALTVFDGIKNIEIINSTNI